MTTTFVDASFLIAVLRKGDALPGRAMAWQKTLTGSLLTTEYVLVEVFDALSAPAPASCGGIFHSRAPRPPGCARRTFHNLAAQRRN